MKPGDYTRGRARTDTETFVQMLPELRARAFAVQGIDDFAQLKRIQNSVAKLPEGGDWKTLQKEIAAELGGDDAEATRKRAETVLRTNGFQAYAAARYRKQQADAEIFPYWKYVTMDDGRVRDRHADLDGVILPANDPFWKDHYPPWDFNCRCIVIEMDEQAAKDEVAAGEGSMWDQGMREKWMAEHAGMDASRQFHFRPDSLDMDLRDLAKAEGRTPKDMKRFGQLMETRQIGTGEIAADGVEKTTTVREWLLKPVRTDYHARARDVAAREEAWAANAWTGADVAHVKGGAHGVSLADVPTDGGAKMVFHNHPSGNPLLSPRDVLAAARGDIERLEAVGERGWMRVSVRAASAEMRQALREWQARLDAAAADPDSRATLLVEWRQWLAAQRRYGYLEIAEGAPLA